MNPHFALPPEALTAHVDAARARTHALVADLSDDQLMGPQLQTVNPLLWELGHVAFFYEAMALRPLGLQGRLLDDNDALYNSFEVAHDDRWALHLPDRQGTLDYLARTREALAEHLAARGEDPLATYVALLGVFHEDMHDEAFVITRQTLGYPAPALDGAAAAEDAGPWPGDVAVPGGEYALGALQSEPWVFDNEKWAHPVQVAPFRMARAPVTNAEYVAFVEDGGYEKRELWGREGWLWKARAGLEQPAYWRRGAEGGWEQRRFDRWEPLRPHAPVIHVSWYEAQAWCAWAGRRLPTEAEWELAASAEPRPDGQGIAPRKRRYPWGGAEPGSAHANLDARHGGPVDVAAHPEGDSAFGCRQMLGNVWEWTADAFYPYPGYIVDTPYREYSAPWFGHNKVLRGGCWVTRPRLLRNTWRNFYGPGRNDVLAGFRTCAR